MLIECRELIEQEDGSATCVLELDNEAKEKLLNIAFLNILKAALEENKLETTIS